MNKFNKIYEIICKDILLEGKIEALQKWGDTEETNQYIEKFMNKNCNYFNNNI